MTRLIYLVALIAALLALRPEPVHPQSARRIVTIGDVHGAIDAFSAILTRAGLINEQKRWIGGRAILVQTGDMTDRGVGMRPALDLLMALDAQASKAGGAVHAILGNHEVLNLLGEMRDATPDIFQTFGGEPAMREAFGPRGHYGRWLRKRSMFVKIDGSVFMHAGISPEYAETSLDDLNRHVRSEIEQWDAGVRWLVSEKRVEAHPTLKAANDAARVEIERINVLAEAGKATPDMARTARLLLPLANVGTSSLLSADGPLWFRGFSQWEDAQAQPLIEGLISRHRVQRFVTGHTVQPNGTIRDRFERRLFLIDTGMLGRPYFSHGRPSALVIEGDKIAPLYLD